MAGPVVVSLATLNIAGHGTHTSGGNTPACPACDVYYIHPILLQDDVNMLIIFI